MPWERSDGWFVKTWLTAYAYAVVKRAAPGPALLSLGSDDGVRVWANGTLVHQHDGPRPLVFDEDRAPVDLSAGDNGVLVETEQRRGPWAFSLRILEPRTVVLPMAEIGPAVLEEESSPATLVVRTDVPSPAPGGADVSVEVIAPGGWAAASAGRLAARSHARRCRVAGKTRRMLADLVLDRTGGDVARPDRRRCAARTRLCSSRRSSTSRRPARRHGLARTGSCGSPGRTTWTARSGSAGPTCPPATTRGSPGRGLPIRAPQRAGLLRGRGRRRLRQVGDPRADDRGRSRWRSGSRPARSPPSARSSS